MDELIVSAVRPSTFADIFSFQTTEPNEFKFHMKTSYDRGIKVYSNCPSLMTKPIYDKTL